MNADTSSSRQKFDDSLFETASNLMANEGIYKPYLAKTVIQHGAVYWPLWDGTYLFISPEDRVKGIVSSPNIIPFGQKLKLLEVSTAAMSMIEFQTQVLQYQNKKTHVEVAHLKEANALPGNFLKYLLVRGLNWFKKLNTKEVVISEPLADFEVSFNRAYETYTGALSQAITELKIFGAREVFCLTISGNRLLRYETNASKPRFEICGVNEVFSEHSKDETIDACREVLGVIFEDM